MVLVSNNAVGTWKCMRNTLAPFPILSLVIEPASTKEPETTATEHEQSDVQAMQKCFTTLIVRELIDSTPYPETNTQTISKPLNSSSKRRGNSQPASQPASQLELF